MHRCLLIKAFEKAKKEIGSTKGTRLAEHLSDVISRSTDEGLGERRLRDCYNLSINNSDSNIELRPSVVNSLCQYLGYNDFKDFDDKNKCNEEPISFWNKIIKLIRQYWVLILLILVAIGLILSISIKKTKWMVWKENHYVEVSFDTNTYKVSELKLYDEDRILYFKKITPDCETEFFKPDGLENLWYGKSAQGDLEYFTALGKHPETGKTLKPITAYMIRKYICETYK